MTAMGRTERGIEAREIADVVGAIDRTWFGAAFAPETQARLAALGRIVEAGAGAKLLTEGQETDDVSIVLAGRVALRMQVPERGMVTILTVEEGDLLGWSALVPPHRATSEAIAVEPVRLLAFNGADLRAALRADHALAASVYPRVLQAVARRLSATRLQLLDLFSADRTTSERTPW